MRDDKYRLYLDGKLSPRAAGDYVSRCKRIEKSLMTNLDIEYKKDGGNSLLSIITYPADGIVNGSPVYKLFNFKNNEPAALKRSLDSICVAAKEYFEFCSLTEV